VGRAEYQLGIRSYVRNLARARAGAVSLSIFEFIKFTKKRAQLKRVHCMPGFAYRPGRVVPLETWPHQCIRGPWPVSEGLHRLRRTLAALQQRQSAADPLAPAVSEPACLPPPGGCGRLRRTRCLTSTLVCRRERIARCLAMLLASPAPCSVAGAQPTSATLLFLFFCRSPPYCCLNVVNGQRLQAALRAFRGKCSKNSLSYHPKLLGLGRCATHARRGFSCRHRLFPDEPPWPGHACP